MNALVKSFSVAQDDLATPVSGKSSGKSSGKFAARKFDMHGYRRRFPDLWSGFLRSHFSGYVEVAYFFDMADASTARHWWNGTNAPSAHFVTYAIDNIPGALEYLRAA